MNAYHHFSAFLFSSETSLEILHICCCLDFFFIVTNPDSLVCVMDMKDLSFLIRKKASNLSHTDADGSIPVEEHLLEKTVPKSDDHKKIEKTYAEALMSQL